MFDAEFYRTVLPDRVTQECQGRPGSIPVVRLHLANGQVMDLCHIDHLSDTWLAAQYFRDAATCEDMEIAFLPYELVTMVTITLHRPSTRRAGFRLEAEAGAKQ